MWVALVVSLVVVSPVFSMKRHQCTVENVQHTLRFFPELSSYPINMGQVELLIKGSDDWQICEHYLMPRICVLDAAFGKMLNNYKTAARFSEDMRMLASLGRTLDAKCNTRNAPTDVDNSL